jgi:hypothetical protein
LGPVVQFGLGYATHLRDASLDVAGGACWWAQDQPGGAEKPPSVDQVGFVLVSRATYFLEVFLPAIQHMRHDEHAQRSIVL